MTWHASFRSDQVGARVTVEETFPYLSVLLSMPTSMAPLAERRASNLVRARRDETLRPRVVVSRPYHVVVDPASTCNLRCPLCVQATDPNGRRRQVMEPSTFHRLLNSVSMAAIRLDLFNWGEPLLNPHLTEFVRAANEFGLHTRVSTNLSLPLNRSELEALVASGLRCLVVSIDGATQQVYEKYRRRGELALVLRNLQLLIDVRAELGLLRPIIEWQFLALRHNVHELETAAALARDIGVDVFRYGGARGTMATKVTRSIQENYRSSQHILLDGAHPLSEYDADGNKRWEGELEGCRWLWGKLAVQADGGVSPCWSAWFSRFDHGNVRDGDVGDIWNSEPFQTARHIAIGPGDPNGATACDTCAYHRAFVNAPDCPEDDLGPDTVASAARRLTEAGSPPAAAVLESVLRGLDTNSIAAERAAASGNPPAHFADARN